ncbi:glycoside hydrolase family 2 protein [Maribellus mangrovi]|uniref:glycoside hydrolase family 2 protein n=1 Tax=Maribellus mangrovi TaxID=3133146 RepID=UPI0030EB63C9
MKNILTILLIFFAGTTLAQNGEILLNKNWKAKRANEIPVDGTEITSPGFKLFDWMDAVVPGTALTTLLHNNKVPDPFYGMNNELIPDIYETGPDFYTFWYRNSFSLPKPEEGQQVWLKFRGINYSANIFLNGKRVNKDTHAGMFLREKYLITSFLSEDGTNNLAVKVEPPNPVGQANGGQGGDGTIARSVTQQYTPGWDWVAPIRDRNTGIWDKVSIEITGAVDIRHPHVKTSVPGKRFPGEKQDPAFIELSAELVNASNKIQEGILTAEIENEKWEQTVSIEANSTLLVELPKIKMNNPGLWWPNSMGEQNRYRLKLSFDQNTTISDTETLNFGIRETGTYFDEKVGGRVFLVNGQKVFIKGGNWISSDAMLRLLPERYEAEVKMHARMNMNMIRIWGGSITERPEFYEACDKYGVLVWQDLWVTGDCNGRWPDPRKKESQERRRSYPDDHSLFLTSMIDQIKMLRNHPSLYLWCGGNEFPPPDDINDALANDIFPKYDGTRYYVNESTSDSILRNTIGGNGDGPYRIQDPLRFFVTPSYPFNPELGSVGLPNVETMRRIMDEKDLYPPRNDRGNRVWQYHKYIGYGDHIENFGEIKGIEDFCKKAQVVNYEQYRALQEGFNAGMWDMYTGMLVWKNQNPWTSLRGQFYDVFLDQNGGFYGYQHGAVPVHVQLNLNDSSFCVVNQTCFEAKNLNIVASYFDLHGKLVNKEEYSTSVKPNSYEVSGKIDNIEKPEGLWFLRLELKNEEGLTIDENLYWLKSTPEDMEKLEELSPVQLVAEVEKESSGKYLASIENNTDETAFFTRLKAIDKTTGKMVLPVFFSDNYFTLFPGERKVIKIDISHLDKPELRNIELMIEPFNGIASGKTVPQN